MPWPGRGIVDRRSPARSLPGGRALSSGAPDRGLDPGAGDRAPAGRGSATVEIAVGIILFEGALRLKREELGAGVRPAVLRLITAGVLITWAGSSLAIGLLFDVPNAIALLIGAIVIISGPTVVSPILNFISPSTHVRSVLKWEGILIDPIGAIIAVVIFGSIVNQGGRVAVDFVEILASLGSGLLAGVVAALLLMPLLASRP
jgi:NhaP-type Na+/H+ or K+/H+ antiporter